MVADPFTKYLAHAVWWRHMHYILNLPGPVPNGHPVAAQVKRTKRLKFDSQ